MDPATLATTVVSVLSPYFVKGAEEFVKSAGKDAYDKLGHLFSVVKKHFAANSEGEQAAQSFEKNPQRYEGVLSQIIAEELAKPDGAAFAAQLTQHLNELPPTIRVRQQIQVGAVDTTGVDIDELRRANVDVVQDTAGKNTTGARIKLA